MSDDFPILKDQALTICRLQTKFNQGLDKDWPTSPTLKRDDMMAVIVELGERADHLGYKWWKAQTPDKAQADMELIDVLHFALSDIIEVLAIDGNKEPVDAAADMLYEATRNCNSEMQTDEKWLLRLTAYEGRPDLERPLAFGPESLRTLMSMLYKAYGNGQEVFVHYIGKNALNKLRQLRGYKEGTYIKEWQGEEDNEVMTRLLMAERHRLTDSDALEKAVSILIDHYDKNIAQQ